MDASAQPSEWSLCPAEPSDLDAIAGLLAKVGQPALDSSALENISVVEADGEFAGCIGVRTDQDGSWLEHFAIDPAVQDRGLGSAVLDSVLARTDADGLRVQVKVGQGSAARDLLERHGFIEESREATDVVMVRLSGSAVMGDLVARLRAVGCVYAEEEAAILLEAAGEVEVGGLEALVARRVAGEPLEYVVGWAEFCGMRVGVADGVFVPRRRTEQLVELAVAMAPEAKVVVDLCCGSGALGLAFAARVQVAELHAADVEPRAVACARRNLAEWSRLTGLVPRPARPPDRGGPARLLDRRASSPSASEGGQSRPTIEIHQGDLFEALPDRLRGRVGVLLANTPYVPTDEIALLPGEARDHEPTITLDGGTDGLATACRVVDGAGEWLAPGGWLLIEASDRQATTLRGHMERRGLIASVHGSVVAGKRGMDAPL